MARDSCSITPLDMSHIEVVSVPQESGTGDFQAAMALANIEADKRYDEYLLISWYDRDRNFESPQHATESSVEGKLDGYIYYALSHGATLKVDIEEGRFVFFYTAVEW